MPGYVYFQEDVFDHERFEEYKKQSVKSITQYGGKFIVRGGEIQVLEGDFNFSRVVIIEFPSVQVARDWYESEEYAAAKALRLEISKGEAVLVAGTS